jgi:histidinol dehydrogenase
VVCWQKSIAIEKVGLYIPGGTAPLFSTVLMLATPAKIAGCKDIVLCTPPDRQGKVNPAILVAARIAGVSQIFKAGGVQAIGAMAYGTESIPKVYKIFGPGNQYVMAAKQQVSLHDVAIDMPAGPSEVCVIADDTSRADFVAADLLSQAEHGIDSQVILISLSEQFIKLVQDEIEKQLALLPRKEMAAKALENSKLILVKDADEAMALSNAYAPEHLIIATENYNELSEKVINAGSVFLGKYACESAGDYASGTNHTLPTHGYALAYNGVNLDSYNRKVTFQHLNEEGIRTIGKAVELMAENEQLEAHANAMRLRRFLIVKS